MDLSGPGIDVKLKENKENKEDGLSGWCAVFCLQYITHMLCFHL
jgi:hypothetical protein